MVNYKDRDPKGWCGDPKRGAAMGRNALHTDATFAGKLHLQKIRLNQGGYDHLGTYFGAGYFDDSRMYWYADENGKIDAMVRASNRQDAKNRILQKYPLAKFYR